MESEYGLYLRAGLKTLKRPLVACHSILRNKLADGSHGYSYNAEGQIAAVTDQGVSYVYDAEGKRIATYTSKTGTAVVTAEYLNDTAGNLVATLNPNHTLVRGILRDNLGTHSGDYVGGPQGERAAPSSGW